MELKWKLPNISGTSLGVPIMRSIAFGALYWAPPILGNYQVMTNIMVLDSL